MVQPGTILLVEDAESDAILIREAFRKARIANPIFRVATGRDALSYLQGLGSFTDRSKHPMPDVVLLDLGLPDTSGLDILRRIKASEMTSGIPVVVVTGNQIEGVEGEVQHAGASGFFRKALKFEDLLAIVQKIGGQWGLRVPKNDN